MFIRTIDSNFFFLLADPNLTFNQGKQVNKTGCLDNLFDIQESYLYCRSDIYYELNAMLSKKLPVFEDCEVGGRFQREEIWRQVHLLAQFALLRAFNPRPDVVVVWRSN